MMVSPIRVLLVDDEPALLEVIKESLEVMASMDVTTCQSVDAAFAALEKAEFDAIISDYQMPGKDGLAFLSDVRRSMPSLPFILFTGRGREEVVIEALNRGADYYLQKGGDPQSQFTELVHMVRMAVQNRSAIAELKASEAKYRSFLHNTKGIVYRYDIRNLRIDLFDGEVEEYTGHSPQDFLEGRMDAYEIIAPEDQDRVIDAHKSAMVGDGGLFEITYHVRSKDGTVRLVSDVGHRILDQGAPAYIIGRINDITEKERLENALRESECRWKFALEGAGEGVWDWDLTTNIIDFSPQWKAMTGFDDGDVSLVPNEWKDLISPDDLHRIEDIMNRFLADELEFYETEHRLRCKDGSYKWVLARGMVISRDAKGRPLRVIGTHTDIDQLKRSEIALQTQMAEITTKRMALQDSDEMFRAFISESSDAIVLIDENGKVIEWNHALERVTGIMRQLALGRDYIELIAPLMPPETATPERVERTRSAMIEALRTGQSDHFHRTHETVIVDAQGTRRVMQQVVFSIHLRNGIKLGSISRDITDLRKAEEDLVRSRNMARTIIDGSYDALFIHDSDGKVLEVNNRLLDMYHISREEAIGLTIRDFSDERMFEEQAKTEIWKKVMAGENFFFPWKARRPTEDTYFDVEVYLTSLSYGDQKLILATTRDVTERRMMEKRLEQSQALLRRIVDSQYDALFIHELDGTIVDVNATALKTFGFSREMAVSRNIMDLAGPLYSREKAERMWAKVVAGEDQFFAQTIGQKKNGENVEIEVFMTKVVMDGRDLILNNIRDVTERKRADKALREAEENYRRLVQNIHEIIYTVQPDGVITYVSPSWTTLMGYEMTEYVGNRFSMVIYEEDRQRCREFLRRTVETLTKQPSIEYRVVRKDGAVRWHRSYLSPLLDEKGALVSLIGSVTDITEYKMAAEALSFTNRKLNLLSSITRHDILNQIMAVQGNIELAKMAKDEKDRMKHCERIGGLMNVIQKQIEFTREYEQLGEKEPVWLPVASLVEKTRDDRVPIVAEVEDVEIFADPMIETVARNLMDNTIRHGQGATKVMVNCYPTNGGLTIVWEDNGCGVPEEQKERVFERGYGTNTGLGLFLAREILGITGITIKENGTPGKGARFEMTVPGACFRHKT